MQVNVRKIPMCKRGGCGHPRAMHEHFHNGGATVYCGHCGSTKCPWFQSGVMTPADLWFLLRAAAGSLRAIR